MCPNCRQALLSEHLLEAGFFETPGFLRDGFEIQMLSENGVFFNPLKFFLKQGAIEVAPRCPRPERVIQP